MSGNNQRKVTRMTLLKVKWRLVLVPIISLLWFSSTLVVAGYFYPGYSHVQQFISVLGATGAPHAGYVNYLGFFPTEVLLLVFFATCYVQIPHTRLNRLALFFYSVYATTLAVAAFVPCDAICQPETPSQNHTIHMASASVGYICGIIATLCLALGCHSWTNHKAFKRVGYGVTLLVSLALVTIEPDTGYAGLSQRIVEFTLFVWFIFWGYHLRRHATAQIDASS